MKRPDLQGIRGSAILSVILFHFFPDRFPNGYIGVDQFFVLSGFLISLVLHKHELNFHNILEFYYKRVKRIVPLYVPFSLATLLLIILLLPYLILRGNVSNCWKGLLFVGNTPLIIGNQNPIIGYFENLKSTENLYTHTWSLAVEMQFYSMVPFLFLICRYLPLQFGNIAIIIISLYLHLVSDLDTTFNNVFCRLWQFFTGVLVHSAFSATEQHLTLDGTKRASDHQARNGTILGICSNLAIFILAVYCYSSVTFPSTILRIVVTFLTGVIIGLGSKYKSPVVCHRFLVFLGDISFALYLIHWPVYVTLKIYHWDSNIQLLGGILFSGLLATLVTKTYESYYLRQDKKTIFLLMISFYIIHIAALDQRDFLYNHSWAKVLDYKSLNLHMLTTEEKINLNLDFDRFDIEHLMSPNCTITYPVGTGWCRIGQEHLSGSNRILVIGNSYASNHLSLIERSCANKAKEIEKLAIDGCEFFADNFQFYPNSPIKCNASNMMLEFAEKSKPDYAFVLNRFMLAMGKRTDQPYEDLLFKLTNDSLTRLQVAVKHKIYILESMPVSFEATKAAIASLKTDQLIDDRTLVYEDFSADLSRERLRRAVALCSKCQLIDYVPTFTKNGVFQFYDKTLKLAYFNKNAHVTPLGLEKVAKLYDDICDQLP